MPAVQVEALAPANEAEAAALRGPDTTTRVGRAIAEGVRRFFED
jgi:N-acetylmuramoyl-L-alanine amidase